MLLVLNLEIEKAESYMFSFVNYIPEIEVAEYYVDVKKRGYLFYQLKKENVLFSAVEYLNDFLILSSSVFYKENTPVEGLLFFRMEECEVSDYLKKIIKGDEPIHYLDYDKKTDSLFINSQE